MSAAIQKFLDLSMVEQIKALQEGEVGVAALTKAALDRAERLQSAFNCFIRIDRDRAETQARRLDTLSTEQRRAFPLFGVPVAHKDIYDREGHVVTFASKLYADRRATETATVLRRFDDAGAVDIGSLNLSEFASNPYGVNTLVGNVRNPWNTDHIAGGSSSGSAAALAARIIAASLGSDTGGSIRGPAAACGVFGLLPTNSRISRHGVLPLSHSMDNVGILARSARDIARVLGVVAGHDPNDASSSREPVADYEIDIDRGMTGLKIGMALNYYPDAVDADAERMLVATLEVLRSLGATIVPLEVPDPRPLDALGNILITAEAAAYHREDLHERSELYTPMVRDRVQFGFAFDAPSYVDALRLRGRELARYIATVFGKVDVLLLPAVPHTAPRHADIEAMLSGSSDISFTFGRFTRSFNYLGLPSLAVPHGRSERGMPLAFQIVGRPFDEKLLLRIAHAFERTVPLQFPPLPADAPPSTAAAD